MRPSKIKKRKEILQAIGELGPPYSMQYAEKEKTQKVCDGRKGTGRFLDRGRLGRDCLDREKPSVKSGI